MKIGKNNKLPATILALSALLAISVIVLIHGCKTSTYPTEDNSLVSSDITSTVTVTTTGALQSIEITRPLADSLDAGLLNGKTDYFVATGAYLDIATNTTTSSDITTLVTWSSSDPTTAQVKTYKTGFGMGIMGMKVGSATITATLDGKSASIPLTIVVNTGY